MVLSHVDVEGKQLVFNSKRNWSLQALTVDQIVFFGVNDDKLINTKLNKRALSKRIDGILLGSSLGRCFFLSWQNSKMMLFVKCLTVALWMSSFMDVIVSITKFSIVIGSPCTYLSRNRRMITWVSNYRYPIWTFCNWIPIIIIGIQLLDTHVIFTSIMRALMASFAMFPTDFNTYEKHYRLFRSKKTSQKTFLIPKFVIDMIY